MINLSSAEFVQRVVKVNEYQHMKGVTSVAATTSFQCRRNATMTLIRRFCDVVCLVCVWVSQTRKAGSHKTSN